MRKKREPSAETINAKPQAETWPKKQKDLPQSLKQAEEKAMNLFGQTLEALNALAQIRSQCKLSNSRVAGVYRELKELAKVMSIYK